MIGWIVWGWCGLAWAQEPAEPAPARRGPEVYLGISLGPETLVLDRFWHSHGAHGSLQLDVWVLGLEIGGSVYPIAGPTRITRVLGFYNAEPLVAEIGARGSVLGWFEPLRARGDGWTTSAGIAGGYAGIVPAAEAGFIGPIGGAAWAIGAEARADVRAPLVRQLGLRARLEGAVFIAGFPEEQELLQQQPLWAGVDVLIGLL